MAFILHWYIDWGILFLNKKLIFYLMIIDTLYESREVLKLRYNNFENISKLVKYPDERLKKHREYLISYCYLCAEKKMTDKVYIILERIRQINSALFWNWRTTSLKEINYPNKHEILTKTNY